MRYYPYLGMLFVALLLTANVIGEKPLQLGKLVCPAGLLVFPMTYLIGDVLAEVYGFEASRRIIWGALLANLFLAGCCYLAILLPAADAWPKADAYAAVLGTSARLMLVSILTYFIGELTNTLIVARLKRRFKGRFFIWRGLLGSGVGEAIETTCFMMLAFYGTRTKAEIWNLILFVYSFKVSYALLCMPLMARLAAWLQRQESSSSLSFTEENTPLNLKGC